MIRLRQNKIVEKGQISITAKEDLFILSRYSEEGELVLIANQSGKEFLISYKGELLLKNQFEVKENAEETGKIQGKLKTDGFLIFKGSKDDLWMEQAI